MSVFRLNRPVLSDDCQAGDPSSLKDRNLIIASNRGPVTVSINELGLNEFQRSGGGLVTALVGLAHFVDATWIASAQSEADSVWGSGSVPINDEDSLRLRFIPVQPDVYYGYYNVIANPLLWFLQHNMWDMVHAPTINHRTWNAWENGYVAVNRLFAQVIAEEIDSSPRRSLVMLQDYHLYLAPRMLRQMLPRKKAFTLVHFVHIPWPGTEDWGILPPKMRRGILEGLCAVDVLGFQTEEDGLNFIRTCEIHLPHAHVNFRRGRVWYRSHATHVRDFPISIDVQSLHQFTQNDEVQQYRQQFEETFGQCRLVVRIDRLEPSKNIARGFQAFGEMLELHPEHIGKVQFLALLVPSRMEVTEYQDYLDDVMAAAGRINAVYGDSDWEPVRVIIGENFARAVAALQIYDALLVNSIADGMNLVAKEGATVNQRDGVIILSERTGARQQLEVGALVISPCDVYATAEAIHQSLTMAPEERQERAMRMRQSVEQNDINEWLCRQLSVIEQLGL